MSKSLQNAVGRLERALGFTVGSGDIALDEHGRQEWVPAEDALRAQLPLLGLYASWSPKSDWFDERRAAVERMFPSGGYWRERLPAEDELQGRNLCRELLQSMRSSSRILYALEATPALRARLDARRRDRLRRYLTPDDPLQQPLLAPAEGELALLEGDVDLVVRAGVEIELQPASYAIVDPAEKLSEGRA